MGALASSQYGVVARRQLLALGFSPRQIELRIASGWLQPLQRDVYAVGHRQLNPRGIWLTGVLACGEGAVLSHGSAAALWGLRGAHGRVEVTAPRGRQGAPGRVRVRLHRGRLFAGDATERDRIPVTSVARTVFDFSEITDYSGTKALAEEADRMRLLRFAELERLCRHGRGRRALKPIRRLLSELRTPTTTHSPLEDRFHDFCEAHRLPRPATNVLLLGHEVDALWPAAKLVVELDSWEFHGHRAAFGRDRALDSQRLVAGYRTVRVTHDRLDHEAATLLAELTALLAAPK